MTKYLPAINDYDEVKYDFLANKNSKFLFHLFNKYQENRGRKKQAVRHTKVSADDYALQKLQDRNWPYFINRIIEFSQGVFDLNDVITTDADEVNILNNARANFEIVKNLYNELLTTVGINLHEYFINLDIEEKQKIDTDLTNNNYFTWDPHEVYIQTRILLFRNKILNRLNKLVEPTSFLLFLPSFLAIVGVSKFKVFFNQVKTSFFG